MQRLTPALISSVRRKCRKAKGERDLTEFLCKKAEKCQEVGRQHFYHKEKNIKSRESLSNAASRRHNPAVVVSMQVVEAGWLP